MCIFVTTVLTTTNDEAVFAVFRQHGRKGEVSRPRWLEGMLKPGERAYISFSRQGCDCGTGLGLGFQPQRDPEAEAAKHRERMRAKGWGEAKIARALAESGKAAGRPRPDRTADVEEWESIVRDLAARTGSKRIGLLMHMYGGSIEGERFEGVRCEHEGNLREGLQTLPEDELRMLAPAG